MLPVRSNSPVGERQCFHRGYVMELTISTPRLAAARILPRTPRAFYRTAINAFFFVMGMVFASWAVRIPDIKAALQMSDAALGSVLLAAPLGEMLSIAPTAWLIGRFRSRRVIMLGLMLMPCALLSLALAGSPHWLAAALLGFGFANNMLNISLNAQAVGVETLYGRSIMATFHGMWSLGGVAGCIIGSIVAPLGVAPLPHFAAILVITLATLCCLRTWTMPREVRIGAAAPESGKRSFRPDLYLTLLGCIALGSMATEGAMYDWSSVYFAQVVQPGESLIRAGCFDRMGYKRKALMQSVDRVLNGAASESRMNLTGQMNLFSAPDDGGAPTDTTQLVLPDVEEFTRAELMAMERETTGLYLTGHPMDDYRALAQQAKAAPMGDILASFHAPATAAHRYRDGQRVVLAGICTASRERATRKNTRMAYLQLEDDGGSMEVLVFSPALDACRDLLAQENPALFVSGRISTRDESDPQLVADKVLPLTEQGLRTLRTPPRRDPPPRPEPPKRHRLWVRLPDSGHPALKRIELILKMFPGDEQLVLVFEDTGKRAAARCVVHPALVEELRELAGPGNVAVTEEKTR